MSSIERPTACPEPVRRAVMRQQWKDLAYLHWRYDPIVVQSLLPKGLSVDTFDGSAWVGLIPFSMRDVGLARGPSVPYLGSFAEVNVRTYVHVDNKPGVYFFSLDVDRLLPALVARMSYRIPYCWGFTSHNREGSVLRTDVNRKWPHKVAHSGIEVEIEGPVEADDLDVFLTARWGLYSKSLRGLRYAPVDHEPWPLQSAKAISYDSVLVEAAGFPKPEGEPHTRFSDGVHVRIGTPQKVRGLS